MLAEAKTYLQKNNINLTDERFLSLKKALEPHYGWMGFLTKLMYQEDCEVDQIINLYEALKKHKVNLAEIRKLSLNQITTKLDQLSVKTSPHWDFVGTESDYDIYRIHDIKGIHEWGSGTWCIRFKKYWDAYVVPTQCTQYVLIKRNVKLNKAGEFLSDYTYVPGADLRYSRFGVTLNCQYLQIFTEDNQRVIDTIFFFEYFPNLLRKDLEYRLKHGFLHKLPFYALREVFGELYIVENRIQFLSSQVIEITPDHSLVYWGRDGAILNFTIGRNFLNKSAEYDLLKVEYNMKEHIFDFSYRYPARSLSTRDFFNVLLDIPNNSMFPRPYVIKGLKYHPILRAIQDQIDVELDQAKQDLTWLQRLEFNLLIKPKIYHL